MAKEVKSEPLTDNTVEEVAAAIKKVAANKDKWAKLPVADKVAFVRQMIDNVAAEHDNWVKAACAGHGYDINDPAQQHLVAEVTLVGPGFCGGWLNTILHSYEHLQTTGRMPAPQAVTKRPNATTRARVFPWGVTQSVFAAGITADVVLSSQDDNMQYDPTKKSAGLWGILGAGNVDVPVDAMTCLFVENKVVVMKANPVNQHTSPNIARVFKPLVDAGFIAFVIGGVAQGGVILNSEEVEHVVMTGSCKTYDKIVWGSDEKKTGKPVYTKPFTAELGSVSSYVLVPGQWTDRQMEVHAQQLVTAKMVNNAHVCASPQVLITCKKWPQREEFLKKVRAWLARAPATKPFYPACERSYAAQLKALTEETKKNSGELIVKNSQLFKDQQSPIFAEGVGQDSFATQNEAFCPVLVELPLDTEATAKDFLPAAVKYINTKLWGSLTSTIIIDEPSQASARDTLETAIDDLQVGSVGINQVAAFSYMFGSLPWGAYPGRHNVRDIQSGFGKVGNLYCYNNVLKAVVRAPFTFPAQVKVPVNGAAALKQQRRLSAFFIYPTTWRLVQLLANALAGL